MIGSLTTYSYRLQFIMQEDTRVRGVQKVGGLIAYALITIIEWIFIIFNNNCISHDLHVEMSFVLSSNQSEQNIQQQKVLILFNHN